MDRYKQALEKSVNGMGMRLKLASVRKRFSRFFLVINDAHPAMTARMVGVFSAAHSPASNSISFPISICDV